MAKRIVRALYDYSGGEESALSFRKGDIIQVLTQLESGWWDGLCNGERGWFPSNYVSDLEVLRDAPPNEQPRVCLSLSCALHMAGGRFVKETGGWEEGTIAFILPATNTPNFLLYTVRTMDSTNRR